MFPFRTCLALALCLFLAGSTVRGEPPAERQLPRDRRARLDLYGDPLPDGAVARLGTTRFRPGGESWLAESDSFALALSPDGKLLATGDGGNVRFWEVATGKELRSVYLGFSVRAVVFSPDGKLFTAHVDDTDPGADMAKHTLHVGEVAGGKVHHQLLKKRSGCREVAFSPDGTMLAAFRHDKLDAEKHEHPGKGLLVLWDVHTGEESHQFKDVFSAAFTPDGKKPAVGKKDGSIQILDPGTGREVQRFEGHSGSVQVLSISPDGRSLVSAAGPNARLWDLRTGSVRHRWQGHDGTVDSVQFSPDGQTIAIQDSKGNLLLYEAVSGKERHRFPTERNRASAHAFSPDGKVLLLQEKEGPFREWDIAKGEERRRWGGQTSAAVMVYAPDGKVLASRGSGGLFVWDVAAGKELHPFPGHRAPVRALAFSLDGRFIASRDKAGVFGIWEASTGKPLLAMSAEQSEAVQGFGFSADGTILSAIGGDGTVRVWEPAAGMKVRQFRLTKEKPVHEWVYRPDGKVLAVAGADNAIYLWDLVAGKELQTLRGHQGQVGSLLFSSDGRLLVSEGKDRNIRLWDVGTGKELAHFEGGESEHPYLLFSPDSKVLVWGWIPRSVLSGSADGTLHLWDTAGRKELRRLAIGWDLEGPIAFLRDGKTVAVAGRDAVHVRARTTWKELRTVAGDRPPDSSLSLFRSPDGTVLARARGTQKPSQVFFDITTGQRLENVLPWGGRIYISPDGKTLIQADDTLRVVEMLSGDLVGTIPGGHRGDETALAFSADGKLLATGGSDGTILLWDWRRACGLVPGDREKIGARELEQAWNDLGRKPGKTAYRAIGTLAAAGDDAVAWLGQRLQPVGERDREAIRRLIAALDDNRFEQRAQAGKELEQLGADAEPILRQALADKPSPEVARRVETLLAGPNISRFSTQTLQKLRAVQALEQIGTAKARDVLDKLSRGIPEARLTREAQDARERLSRP
jgi:WD40 repeat protein